jgi:3',5'-cyclic AMP phosphodiesterase CpdA
MRLVTMADTHGEHHKLTVPPGDVLVHAGDLTGRGTLAQLTEVAQWLRALPHRHKVVVGGNHDFWLQGNRDAARELFAGMHYLEDEEVVLEGVRFYGSPWQPWFHDWAFNASPRGSTCSSPTARRWAWAIAATTASAWAAPISCGTSIA